MGRTWQARMPALRGSPGEFRFPPQGRKCSAESWDGRSPFILHPSSLSLIPMKSLSVIIPIYNERELLPRVLEKLRAVELPLELELILVDDCSTDGTREYLAKYEAGKPGVKVLTHKRNRGKGRAIRTGLEAVTGDIVLIQDADLEYDPSEIPSIIAPIIDGRCEVTYGSRFLGRTPTGMRLPNYVANKLLVVLVALLFWQVITDEATAYKAFRTEVIRAIPLRC